MSDPPAIVGPFGEAALQALIDQAPDGIFVADIDGRYIYVNEAGCRMLGYSRDEVLRMKIADTVLTRDPGRLDRAKAVMLEGRSEAAEWTLRRKDGTGLPVEVNAHILPNGQWHGFVRDVSDRKAHEAEREALFERIESERRRLRTLVDTLPLSVLLIEPGGIVTGNRRVEELLDMKLGSGIPIAQYAGRVLYPDGRPVPRERLVASRVMRGETVIGEEQVVRRPDGSQVPTLGSAAPIRDDEGRIVGGVAVFQDVSERMRLEQAVQANERLLLTVFDMLPVGVWITDEQGRVTRGNPAGRQLWQGTPDAGSEQEGEFKGWWVETGKPIAPEEWAIFRAVRHGETSRRELIRIQCFDGSFKTVINWATPLRSAEGKIIGAVAVNEDITALHQTQEQLRTAVRDREDILAVVTHDLRSPLSAIMTVAATLQLKARALAGGEPVRAMAATLVDIGRQMSGLVSDLLAVALARTDRSVMKIAPTSAFCAAGGCGWRGPAAVRTGRHPVRGPGDRRASGHPRRFGSHPAGLLQPAGQRAQVHRGARPGGAAGGSRRSRRALLRGEQRSRAVGQGTGEHVQAVLAGRPRRPARRRPRPVHLPLDRGSARRQHLGRAGGRHARAHLLPAALRQAGCLCGPAGVSSARCQWPGQVDRLAPDDHRAGRHEDGAAIAGRADLVRPVGGDELAFRKIPRTRPAAARSGMTRT